ncbi:MAG: hypothetical protein RJA98_818 [Pseudomonadota bacterium]|jgi:AcrR family transcriptional regulator
MNAIRPPTERPLRQDGEQSRERLLDAALTLFADKGYARTATREIAESAHTNLAAISYYFGDKAGLYRAVFFCPMARTGAPADALSDPALPLPELLSHWLAAFLEPLAQGDLHRRTLALHMREMLEPTGVWQEHVDTAIRPMHDLLLQHLCRHFGLSAPDAAVQRLAVSIAGLGVHLHVSRQVTDVLAPGLNAAPDAIDGWREALPMYALAMVQAEAQRRQRAAATIAPTFTPHDRAQGGHDA